jgi:5-methylcytosine-specific restriction endonuclease McrA
MENVLILNRNWFAVHVADWQKIICLLYRGHAVAVDQDYRTYNFDEWKEMSQLMEESPNGFVHSINFKIAIPEVVALTYYDELPKNDVRFTRKNLYKHYGHKCCYCGNKFKSEDLNLDHIIPKSRGGKTDWSNIVLSCLKCNSDKDNKTPSEARLKMHYQPSKPVWRPSYAVCMGTGVKVRQSWKKFIDSVYWNSELEQ